MKKLFALLLTLAMVLSLAACGGSTGDSGNSGSSGGSTPPASTGGSGASDSSGGDAETSNWPQSAVTLTVSAGAGGGTDICARILLERLSDFGNFVVQNDTDGGGAVGWERVKAGDPETCSEVIFYNTGLYVSYVTGLTDIHPTEELVPVVCLPTGVSQYICVPKDSPFDTIQDLVDYAKEHPGELQCGVELGSLSHVYVGLCAKNLGIDWTYVSTGSDNDRITLLMGNNIDVTTINQATAQNYYDSGDIKVLAAEQGRSEILGEKMAAVPTLEEAGFDKVDVNTELIVWAPAGAGDATYAAIFDAFKAAIDDEGTQAKLQESGAEYYCPFNSWKECYDNSVKNLQTITETCQTLGLC